MKSRVVVTRCSDESLQVLDALISEANKQGLNYQAKAIKRSSFIRHVIDFLAGYSPYADDREAVLQISNGYQLLVNLSNNLNQLAKAYNQGLITQPVDTENFLLELSDKVDNLIEAQRSYLLLHKGNRLKTITDILDSLPNG